MQIAWRMSLLLSCLAFSSCASVGVKKVQYLTATPPKHVPARILVKPLAFYEPGLNVDRSGAKLAQFKYDLQERLTDRLVHLLPRYVAKAQAVAASAPQPRGNYWLITGQFDQVNQGSRLLRTTAGFGLGATRLVTTVVVTDLSNGTPRPFLMIQTTGGSNATPPLVNLLRTGLVFDTDRTADQITAALSEYLYQQGVFPYGMVLVPKRVGE